jgi:transmembrane sensor
MRRETSQEIDSRAAEWAARIDRGALSSEEDRQLEQWLAGDQRRRGAFMRIRAVALHSERARALGSGYDPDAFLDRPLAGAAAITRRRMLWLGGSAVAAAMIGAVGLRLTGATRYGTRLGEVRVVTLKDGSVITLNTSSSIRVDMGSARRLVALEAGEALFDVASDPARPFIVEAGDAAVRAVGTSFAVRRFGSAPVEVVVREGLVEVTAPSNARPIRMGANRPVISSRATAGSSMTIRMSL